MKWYDKQTKLGIVITAAALVLISVGAMNAYEEIDRLQETEQSEEQKNEVQDQSAGVRSTVGGGRLVPVSSVVENRECYLVLGYAGTIPEVKRYNSHRLHYNDCAMLIKAIEHGYIPSDQSW